MVVILCN